MTTPSEVRRIVVETLNEMLPGLVRQAVAEAMNEPDEDGDKVWPDWYASLWAIPGFKTPMRRASAWLESKGISEEIAENTAYALKGRWPGPKANPYKDVWATFQNWCKHELARSPKVETDDYSRKKYLLETDYESLGESEKAWVRNNGGILK